MSVAVPAAQSGGAAALVTVTGARSSVGINRLFVGVNGLFEWFRPQAGVGGEEGLLWPRAQFQVGIDHLLDRIDDALGAKAWTGDAGQGRIFRARASEQQLVVLIAPLFDAQNANRPDVMVSAGVDAARNLDLEFAHLVLARRQPRRDALGNGNGARIGERTVVKARAGDDVSREPGVGFGQADRFYLLINRPEVTQPHVRQHQILLVGDAHLIEGVALGKLGDRLHLGGRGIAGNAADRFQRNGDDGVTWLLVGMRVAGHPAIEAAIRRAQARRRRPRRKGGWGEIIRDALDLRLGQLEHAVFDAGPFRLDLGGKGVRAEVVDEDFDARLVDVVAPAMQIVDAQDGLDVAQQVRFGQYIADFFGEIGCAPLAAPDPNRKTQAAVTEALQLEANVVGLDRTAVMLRGRDADFELARQKAELGVERGPLPDDFGIGSRIRNFLGRGTGEVVGGDVAHVVARGLDGVHLNLGQLLQDVGNIRQFGPIELQILARGEVPEAPIIGARKVGKLAQLAR